MKNKKLLIVGLIGLVFGVFSQIEAVDPNFDILNKTDHPIRISMTGLKVKQGVPVTYSSVSLFQNEQVKPIERRFILANHFPYTISDLKKLQSLKIVVEHGEGYKQKKEYQIELVNQDTVYVTFGMQDGKLKLYPQTGIAKGMLGRTEAGYSLDSNKNINSEGIKLKN